jgi:hypothetical protein
MTESRRKRLAAVAFVALVVFGAAFAEAAFVHTDDGCTLEIHCLACRWTVGTTAVAPPPTLSPRITLADLGASPEAAPARVIDAAREAIAARGPPPA